MKTFGKKKESFYSDFENNFHITWHNNAGVKFGDSFKGLSSHSNKNFTNKFQTWIKNNDIIVWNSLLHDLVHHGYACTNKHKYAKQLIAAFQQVVQFATNANGLQLSRDRI